MAYSFKGGLFGGKLVTLLVFAATASVAIGCKKKQEAEAEKAEASQESSDRYSDGQRLAKALKPWPKKWRDLPDLPTCEPFLKEAADLELCKTAIKAYDVMRTDSGKPDASQELLMHDASELFFTTYAAWEKLHVITDKLEAERAAAAPSGSAAPASSAAPAPSASAAAAPSASVDKAKPASKPPAPVSSAASKAKPVGSAAPAAKETAAAALEPIPMITPFYARIDREARRYMLQYLQFGPLPTRQRAFAVLEELSKRRQPWHELAHTLREAWKLEKDRDLKGKINTLALKLATDEPAEPVKE